MTRGLGDEPIALPGRWAGFGRRWQAWRERHDRRHWPSSWQGAAFQADRLRFPSPWGDGPLLETRLSLRKGPHLAYLLRDGEGRRALVFAGLVSNGHELEAVYLPEEKEWLRAPVSVAPADWYGLGLEQLTPQLEALADSPGPLAPERRRRLWLWGHHNFAHQLLNGLTCLEGADPAELGPVWREGPEAFGPLPDLFPGVHWQGEEQGREGWFELPLSQRPERISSQLRRLLRQRAAAAMGAEGQALERRLQTWKAEGGWVLAVSVKTRGAVAEGLNALLGETMAKLSRQGQAPLLLMDGFSLPEGATVATVVPPHRCTMGDLMAEEAGQIAGLRGLLAELGGAVAEPVVCAGRPLLEALHLLGYADAYVMHQGTVQHKIGWVQESIPGIVHSNSQRNTGSSEAMGGMGGLAPLWFPASGCIDLEATPRGRYRFRPEALESNVRWLCGQLNALVVPSQDAPAAASPLLVLEVRGEGPGGLEREGEIWAGLVQHLRWRWPELQVALVSSGGGPDLQAQGARIQAPSPAQVSCLIGLPEGAWIGRVARANVAITYPGALAERLGSALPELPIVELAAGLSGGGLEEGPTRLPVGLLTPCLEAGGPGWRVPEELPLRDAIEQMVAPRMGSGSSSTLFDCVWTTADPHAALLAHGERCRAAARHDRVALGELAEVAWATREPELVAEAWEAIERWPHGDGWLRVARLRLRLARRDPAEICQMEAEALLPEVEELDGAARLLLASVLERPVRGLEARVVAPAGPAGKGGPGATETLGRLLGETAGLGLMGEERERAAFGLAAAGPSLRRPYRSWSDPEAAREGALHPLLERISLALKSKRGFSLIRLGDGEGSFLCGRRPDLGGATSNGLRLDPAISQRGGALEEGEHQALIQRFVAAVGRADAIGVPDLDQCLNGPEEAWQVPAGLALRFGGDALRGLEPTLISGGWHLHNFLLADGAYSRPPFLQVRCVIGPSLPQTLRNSPVLHLAVPGERGKRLDALGEDAHYPGVYGQILDTIEQCIGPGDLVLVGAGILGKIYCDAVRSQGGVAIDIGSVIDVASGLTGTRGEYRLHPHLLRKAVRAFAAAPPADPPAPDPPAPGDVVSAIWGSADPLVALIALGRASLKAGDGDAGAVFALCDAAGYSRDSELLAAAGQRLAALPAAELWVRIHGLRLRLAEGAPLEELGARARALLPWAGELDVGNRELLANLLAPEAPVELLPEWSAAAVELLQGGQGTAAVIAGVLAERPGLDPTVVDRAAGVYVRAGRSLRRGFQHWASPEGADGARLNGLVAAITAARREGRGFSLIRLGDGEGSFLAGGCPDLEGATRNGERVDQDLARRGGELAPDQLSVLLERFRLAVGRADVVGLPDLWQCLRGPEQSVAVAAALEGMGAALWPGGWHLHLQLLQHGAFHRHPFQRVDAVIGPALPPALKERGVAFVPLPGEDPHWGGTVRPEAHYPRVYERVMAWIGQQVKPGQLVLVGGGLLGKVYVDAIREQGGVGIDVGSVIDLCDGHTGHRGEHRLHPYLAAAAATAFGGAK